MRAASFGAIGVALQSGVGRYANLARRIPKWAGRLPVAKGRRDGI